MSQAVSHHKSQQKVLEAICRLVVTISRADIHNQIGNEMLAVAPELADALTRHLGALQLQRQGKMALCELQQMGGLPEVMTPKALAGGGDGGDWGGAGGAS